MTLRLQDIYEGSLEFLEPLSHQKTYALIVSEAKRLLQAEYGTIFINSGSGLKRIYSCVPEIQNVPIRQNGRTIKAFRTGEPFSVSVRSRQDIHPQMYPLGIKSIIFIPLSYKQKNVGVLNVLSHSNKKLSKQDRLLLKLFGAMASLAIYKADQYKRAEDSIRARDMFIAVASHELRTPLTTITVYAQLLLSKLSQGIMPDVAWIKTLYAQTQWLNTLTTELLQVNTIKKGKLQYIPEIISLREVIKKAAVSFSATFPKHRLTFIDTVGEKDDLLKADYYKLLQVFINLLNNAGKFSASGSTVTIMLKKEGKNLSIAVEDMGEGIKKKDIPNIFKGFYKGQTNNKEGMGLGLFLVKEIVEHNHGKISVVSRPGFGTTITILFPQKKV